MDEDQRTLELQMQVIAMRSKLTVVYGQLMQQEYQHFTNQLKNGICIIPDKLKNFELMHQPQLEKYCDTIMEVPTAGPSNTTADDLMRKAMAIRRAQKILNEQR